MESVGRVLLLVFELLQAACRFFGIVEAPGETGACKTVEMGRRLHVALSLRVALAGRHQVEHQGGNDVWEGS